CRASWLALFRAAAARQPEGRRTMRREPGQQGPFDSGRYSCWFFSWGGEVTIVLQEIALTEASAARHQGAMSRESLHPPPVRCSASFGLLCCRAGTRTAQHHQSPRLPPSFGCSALHQIAGAVLAASDRALPSQRATRIVVLDGVEARFQSHVAGLGLTWNRLPGPVLLAAAPLMANPGRRWLNSPDHRLPPSTGASHRPHWAIFSANMIVLEVPSWIATRRVPPNQKAMLVVWGLPTATSGLLARRPLPKTWKL